MPRPPSRLLITALALIALVVLVPALATALPQREAVFSNTERLEATPGFFSQLWGFLAAFWSENGSGLDPDGAASPAGNSGSGTEPNAATGDNGSGLEPNG